MSFVKLATVSEVPSGKMKAFELNGQKILLANADGSFYAVTNKCPHIGKPLDKGTLDGFAVECPYHHARFDVRDGSNQKKAKLLFLDMACANAKTYPLKVDGDNVLIELQQV